MARPACRISAPLARSPRTSWVRHAFETMSDIPTHLIAFSDDMDGLRKVPDNLPQPEMLAANLGKPLTSIPIRSARVKASAIT